MPKKFPYGVSKSTEAFIRVGKNVIAFESSESNPNGTSYIRVLNSKGGEIYYASVDECGQEETLGAIFGAALSESSPVEPKYYNFGSDCKFPRGTKLME